MKDLKLIAGLEIEAEYNENVLGEIASADYHDCSIEPYNDDFIAEDDSSLSPTEFDGVIEF